MAPVCQCVASSQEFTRSRNALGRKQSQVCEAGSSLSLRKVAFISAWYAVSEHATRAHVERRVTD